MSDAELKAQALKLPPTLRCLAQAACQQKTTKCTPEEYFKQWSSSAHCAKDADKERWQLLQSVGKAKASRTDFSANLIRRAKDCLNRAHRFGAPEKKSTLGSGTEAANGDSRRPSSSPPVTSRKRRRKSVIFSRSMARRKAAADRPKKPHGGASQPAANAGKLFSFHKSGL